MNKAGMHGFAIDQNTPLYVQALIELRRCEVPSSRQNMITEEEEMDSPTIDTRNTLAKEKDDIRLDKEDSGKCENPRDLQGITGGQMLKTNHGWGHILVHYLMTTHILFLEAKRVATLTEFPFIVNQQAAN